MKTLLNKFWKYSLGLLLLVIIFSAIGIKQCNEEKKTVAIENANTAVLRAFLIDSTRTSVLASENVKLDIVKTKEAKKTETAKASALYWENIAKKRSVSATIYRNKADSLASLDTGQCKDIIQAFRQANDTLQSENVALSNENQEMHTEIQGYSNQLFICEKQSLNKDSIIASHKKNISVLSIQINNYQCYRDWGLKHRFWKWVFGWKCK